MNNFLAKLNNFLRKKPFAQALLPRPFAFIFVLISAWSQAANLDQLPPIPASLVGHWFNTENTATVGLIIQADKTCEMYTERLASPRTSQACKVEFYRDNTYLVFLKGADGQCGASADFEFRYLQEAQRLDLDTGGSAKFLLEKRAEPTEPTISPAKTPTAPVTPSKKST